eukprot:NODE_1153_length_983_cov_81.196262_g1108_i0.p1 GENE.NODE_1153_length_983_cov_81.196262_g1108_i0~~NODE_1153_length_983_cov_81.196262_g1108_i0.p1  ORF type:complete len:312 (-),score=41.08 NODE_1153_length_983_cov_81.196262_g1108_i0:46-876(-)
MELPFLSRLVTRTTTYLYHSTPSLCQRCLVRQNVSLLSIRARQYTAGADQPVPSPEDELVIKALQQNPRLTLELYKNLSPKQKQMLLDHLIDVDTSTVSRHVHDHSKKEFDFADSNSDGKLSQREFSHWFAKKYKTPPAPVSNHEIPTNRELMLHSLRAGIPFVGFGFLDNFVMITAGEYIDVTLGVAFGISTMAAAALGNLMSDVAGLGFGGVIEALSNRIGIPDPKLTLEQQDMSRTRLARSFGNILFVTIGCLLGMVPLLFFPGRVEPEKHQD